MDIDDGFRVAPVFNPYIWYLRSIRYFLPAAAAVGVLFLGPWSAELDLDAVFRGWQRLFPLYILFVTAFFILPGYNTALRKRDYQLTSYRIKRGAVEARICLSGRIYSLDMKLESGVVVKTRRSPLQRIAGIGDVLLINGKAHLRLSDIPDPLFVSQSVRQDISGIQAARSLGKRV